MRSRLRNVRSGPRRTAFVIGGLLLGIALYSRLPWLSPLAAKLPASSFAQPLVTAPPPSASVAMVPSPQPVLWFEGACDASGALEIDERRMAVVDDEDNVIRVYDARLGGAPLHQYDMSEHVGSGEADIEAAARLGDTAFFLASHGRTRKGKLDANRLLFFGSELPKTPRRPWVLPLGRPYRSLLSDMLSDPRLSRLGLEDAAQRAPKALGGLNLEGLTAAPDGTMWIGFRSPVPEGRALLVRMLNPREALQGRPARFAAPVLLDLGGLGIRALATLNTQVLIVAGPTAEVGESRLFRYDGGTHAVPMAGVEFAHFNPEALVVSNSGEELLVLSDDGEQRYDGKRCKKLPDPTQKRFRGAWIKPDKT